jgi:hypothetical protein
LAHFSSTPPGAHPGSKGTASLTKASKGTVSQIKAAPKGDAVDFKEAAKSPETDQTAFSAENVGINSVKEDPQSEKLFTETPKDQPDSHLNKPRMDPEIMRKIDNALKEARSIPWEDFPAKFVQEIEKVGSFDESMMKIWADGTPITKRYGAMISALRDWNIAKASLEKAIAKFKSLNGGMTVLQVQQRLLVSSQIGRETKKHWTDAREAALLRGDGKESDRLISLVEKGQLEILQIMQRDNKGYLELEAARNEEVIKLTAFYKELEELNTLREAVTLETS